MTALIIALIVAIIIIFILTAVIISYKYFVQSVVNDNRNGKHFCNYCKKGYITTKKDRERTHCEDCGRPLTLHCKHPDFVANPNDNVQTDCPFEEFSNKE